MNITLKGEDNDCCLVLEGEMTHPFSRDIENLILDSMHRHHHLKVDLSGVYEVDLCGVHLLGVLRSFGDDAVCIVPSSPVVEAALARLHSSRRSANRNRALRGSASSAQG